MGHDYKQPHVLGRYIRQAAIILAITFLLICLIESTVYYQLNKRPEPRPLINDPDKKTIQTDMSTFLIQDPKQSLHHFL